MDQLSFTMQLLASSLSSMAMGARYSIIASYVVCFYEWIISLDQEVAFIYPAPWNVVKGAYLFCRYYPLAIAPFQLWGLLGNHEKHVCESYYHALYACTIPTMLSAQYILMLRTYAFSGRNKKVLVVLSITFIGLVGVAVWVMSKHLSLSPVFFFTKRSGCFAISDQRDISAPPATGAVQGISAVKVPTIYHLGMISILATFFDCLNMFIVVRHCIRERSTLGTLGQSFLKQGLVVYVVLTALNTLSIGVFFSPQLMYEAKGLGPWFAYILPSALSCRLVLMLRRKASPTETDIRIQCSHMVNEALEMMAVERHPEEITEGFMSTASKDAQALT